MTTEQRVALAGAITVDKEIMHGTPCFTGTRVPVQTLIDFLETGDSIDDFLKVYQYIPREQILTFLELSKAVSARTFEPDLVSYERKLEISDELRKYFAEVDSSRKSVSEEEVDDIITEAMRSVRPGYRPRE